MNSYKPILVEVLITILIAVAVWLHEPWMWWAIIAFTVLMLIAKGFALYSDGLLRWTLKNEEKHSKTLHVLYAFNIILLGLGHWWYPASLWLLIWLFSYISKLKMKIDN